MSGKKLKEKAFQLIKVSDCIEPREQARMNIDPERLNELSQSIKEQGQLSPIEVVKKEDKYEIVFGHRRWLAHKIIGRDEIWARVVEKDNSEMILARVTENIARENLSPLEEGANYLTLREEMKMSVEKIAKKVGRKPGRVKRMLDVMRMPDNFQKALHTGKVTTTVCEALWRCDDPAHRDYLLDLAVDHGVTTLVAAQWVDEHRKSQRSFLEVKKEGEGDSSPMESVPHYMTCEVCKGPEDVTKIKQMVLCPGCHGSIMAASREEKH